jgi:hypothetical protein
VKYGAETLPENSIMIQFSSPASAICFEVGEELLLSHWSTH